MGHDELVIVGRVLLALVLGGLIGMERTIHGRPAGFRTHALVCLTSALLMIALIYQARWLGEVTVDAISAGSSRMAQGIMTGIGFLGAGVIFKEGLTVRGLTTAASIWITAAIGILVGIGFYFVAVLGAAAALAVLALFLALERKMPAEFYMYHEVCFSGDAVPSGDELRKLIASHGFAVSHLTHHMRDRGKQFEYRMTLHGRDPKNAEALSRHLRTLPGVIEFRISPTGD
jgi:putative Mg2+ transporter-C (MgtC) family protein